MSRAFLLALSAALLAARAADDALDGECLAGEGGCGEASIEAAEDLATDAMRVQLLQTGLGHPRARGLAPEPVTAVVAASSTAKAPAGVNTSLDANASAKTDLNASAATEAGLIAEAAALAHGQREAVEACRGSAATWALGSIAPACARACPGMCQALGPAVAALLQGTSPKAAVCAGLEAVNCALAPAHALICGPAISRGEDKGLLLRTLAGDCQAEAAVSGLKDRAAASASVAQAEPRTEAFDATVMGKESDPRCAHAPEGQTCVNPSAHDGGRAYIYCSNHQRLSAGETSCEREMGRLSRCRSDGTGLQIGRCDDPFCRNGGARYGNGNYCHKNNVVFCHGDNEPTTVDPCYDRTHSHSKYGGGSCTVTDHYSCEGGFPDPYCRWQYTSSDCY
mmetsp:Transcript_71239/g.201911  ORF Transcript_71239/g.201911 Transcript_71239/m.201911 type:complete len:396 (-) Transcript_71239:151-1338(-)